ncbi:hypothetical protein LXL04_008335 [Taraxacum kok-saghyz]
MRPIRRRFASQLHAFLSHEESSLFTPNFNHFSTGIFIELKKRGGKKRGTAELLFNDLQVMDPYGIFTTISQKMTTRTSIDSRGRTKLVFSTSLMLKF